MGNGTAKEVKICGKTLRLGDYVEVSYTISAGYLPAEIKGKITELWSLEDDNFLQARVESGWCFHDHDKIVEHIIKEADND